MSKATNAGVDAQIGFEQQRNTAILLLLEHYDTLKNREFFISIEHHEDFLFAFLSSGELEEIEAYQSKKKASGDWRINQELGKIIDKILQAGKDLREDPHPKKQEYEHKLYFISNRNSVLKANNKNKKKSEQESININSNNHTQPFSELPKGIQNTIIEYLCTQNNSSELANLIVKFIDFPANVKNQKELLIGKLHTRFPVTSPKSALETLITLFDNIGKTYNQGGKAKLMDTSKRVESTQIKTAISIITDEQKTYELWRKHSESFSEKMNLSIYSQNNAESTIQKTFEYMKNMKNIDHQRIQNYVRENDLSHSYINHTSLINAYVQDVKVKYKLNISEENIFWTCLCAYVELYEKILK